MHRAFVDIENEFKELEQEVQHLSLALDRHVAGPNLPDGQEAWELAHVLASATEKIYTGCERVMSHIAWEVDGVRIGHSEEWHAALLRRMANPFPEVREAIISAECYTQLDRLRAFRHRERNTYGLNLDLDVVVQRANEAIVAVHKFHQEARTFFADWGNDDTASGDPYRSEV
jgi:hypothetical protein